MAGDIPDDSTQHARTQHGSTRNVGGAGGEAGLLARMLPHLRQGPEVEVGPGDDAALVHLPSPRLVVTTDTMVAGHDFLRHATTARWIGHKAAVQNLADVASMGARPLSLVVAISAPADTPAAVFEDLTIGLATRAEAEGASIVGGDLGRADQLVLTVTAVGSLPEAQPAVLRSGARAGDVLAIGSPRLGRSAAGLALVLGQHALVHAPDGTHPTIMLRGIAEPSAAEMVRWHDAPDPDLALGWTGGRTAHAMMDLSDGLVRDGGRLARASQVTVDLDREALTPDVEQLADLAAELGIDPWTWVLHGGEEHAMLAAFSPGEVPEGFRPIGRILPSERPGPGLLLDGAPVDGEGFDHFS